MRCSEVERCHKYREVQRSRSVTKYKDVQKSTDVLKTREVTKSLLQRIIF